MIYSMTVTNFKNESLKLELSNPTPSGLIVTNIEGIGSIQATINTTDMATADGAWFNSARANTRNIVCHLMPMDEPSVEENRHKIYRYFPVKKKLKLTFDTDTITSVIEGYVETIESDIFSDKESVTVSILCPDPLFYAEGGSEDAFAGIENEFEFPFSDESITAPDATPYLPNQLLNTHFNNPLNHSMQTADNLFAQNYDFRVFSGDIPSEYTEGNWCIHEVSEEGGEYLRSPEGIKISRREDAYTGIEFYYGFSEDALEISQDYTLSVILDGQGLISLTGNLHKSEGDQVIFTKTDEATGIQMNVGWYPSFSMWLVGFFVPPGKSAIFVMSKFEKGAEQTLSPKVHATEWHDLGPTIDNWTITGGGGAGNYNVKIAEECVELRAYSSIEEPLIWSQPISIQSGFPITISALTKSDLYSKTFQPDEYGKFTFEDLPLDDGFVMKIAEDEYETYVEFVRNNEDISNSALLQLVDAKLEYGDVQTLAKNEGGKWIVMTQPSQVTYTGGTIEFGNIRPDTRTNIPYHGDMDTGVLMTIHAMGSAEHIVIYNTVTLEQMVIDTDRISKLTGAPFGTGDDILISTFRGNRYVRLRRETVETNIISAVGRNTSWFQLTPGDNIFAFTARSGDSDLVITFEYKDAYMGV